MESKPQNPEFRIKTENFHPCIPIPTSTNNERRQVTSLLCKSDIMLYISHLSVFRNF